MKIVDAQVHPWSAGQSTGHHRRDPIDQSVLLQEMADAGVGRVVLVPPLWDPNGNQYALQMAAQMPERFSVMGLLDPAQPDAVQALLRWHDQPHMRGVRFLLNTQERLQPYLDGLLEPLWSAAEEAAIPVALLVPGHLEIPHKVAREHPRLQLVVDHLGVPRASVGPVAFKHWPQLLELASLPNIHVKAVGVGDYALDPYPFKSLEEPLKAVFNAFGAERILWGSDLSRLHHSYAQCVTHFSEQLPFLSARDVERVMGQNMLDLLGWC